MVGRAPKTAKIYSQSNNQTSVWILHLTQALDPWPPELPTKAEELSQSLAEGLTEGNNIWLTAFDFGGISTA
jgi:hypothetical protein